MKDETVLIVSGDQQAAARYETYLEGENSDCGFLTVATIQEAVAFCEEMLPDCIVADDSIDVSDLLTRLAGQSGILPCSVITIVRPERAVVDPMRLVQTR
jgi:hypothetical protein